MERFRQEEAGQLWVQEAPPALWEGGEWTGVGRPPRRILLSRSKGWSWLDLSSGREVKGSGWA